MALSESGPGQSQHGFIPIQANQMTGRSKPFRQEPGVPTGADRGIDKDLARLRGQEGQHLRGQNGDMVRLGTGHRSDSRRRI
jgi:hypothetical protein